MRIGDLLLLSWYGGDVALHSMEHASGRSRISCYCKNSCFLVDPFRIRSFNGFDCYLDEGMRLELHLIADSQLGLPENGSYYPYNRREAIKVKKNFRPSSF